MTASKTVRNETFFLDSWADEEEITSRLSSLGYDMDETTWVYSWTIPSWVSGDKRKYIQERLDSSDYHGYLVNVRQEALL